MKTLFLHIGLSKTGSSALQSWLSLNALQLQEQGIDYADLSPLAKDGKITAGNGVPLFHACNNKDWKEVERLINTVYFKDAFKSIVSSETLQNISLESVEKIKEISLESGIRVIVVLFARSVYELLYSNYLQGVKRHGFSFAFGENEGLGYKPQRNFIEKYLKVYGADLIARNYDVVKNEIFKTFSDIVGIDFNKTVVKNKKVNRSLTYSESVVLRRLNAIHKGIFSTQISDFLIDRGPDKNTEVFYSQEIYDKVKFNSLDDLNWLNEVVFQKENLKLSTGFTDVFPKAESGVDQGLDIDTVSVIVDWCFSYTPKNEEEKINFVDFLRDFSDFLFNKDDVLAFRLMSLAHHYRKNGPYIKNKLHMLENRVLSGLKVGVAIVTYNRIDYVKKNVEAVKELSSLPINLLVADDGSSDGTIEWCKKEKVACISAENSGVFRNKNRALYYLREVEKSDVIILLEDDCRPKIKGWDIEWVLASLFWGHVNHLCNDAMEAGGISQWNGTRYNPYFSKEFSGQCTGCSADALNKIGFLDPNFSGYGYGHIEWAERFLNCSYNGAFSKKGYRFPCISYGLFSENISTEKNVEQIENNRKIKFLLQGDVAYKRPWSNDKDKALFLSEVSCK